MSIPQKNVSQNKVVKFGVSTDNVAKGNVAKENVAKENVVKKLKIKIDDEFEFYYPKQLENESEASYNLFVHFLEERNFKKLNEFILIQHHKKVSRRQLFNLAKKYNWRERAVDFDKEINFCTLQEITSRIKKAKNENLKLMINVFDKVNNSMKSFNNQILTDLDVFHQVIDFDDDMKLKRMQSTMKIFKDFVFVSSKIQNILKESGAEDFDILDYLKDFEDDNEEFEENGEFDLEEIELQDEKSEILEDKSEFEKMEEVMEGKSKKPTPSDFVSHPSIDGNLKKKKQLEKLIQV